MRKPVAIAAIAALSVIATDAAAQSRYGPRPAGAPATAAVADLPPEALLNWKGKPAPAGPATAEARGPDRPEPVAPWAQRMASLTPPPARALPEPAVTLPEPAPEAEPRPRLPTSIFDRLPPLVRQPEPRAIPQSPPPPPVPVRAAAPAPAPMAMREPAPAPRPAPASQTALLDAPPAQGGAPVPYSPTATTGPRFYSVYREYGVAPDLIPVAPAPAGAQEVQLKELPQSQTLAAPDDTQYIPPRTNQSDAAANRTH